MYRYTKSIKKRDGGGKPLTVETYTLIFKKIGFSVADLEAYTVGGVLDVAFEFVKNENDEGEREATQDDINSFFKC